MHLKFEKSNSMPLSVCSESTKLFIFSQIALALMNLFFL